MTPSEHAKAWRLTAARLRQRGASGDVLPALIYFAEAIAEAYEERTPKDIPHG